jgi:lipopolysaccharide/colanic/teichoic acid biosynthesis glycosyltransferase
MWRASQAPCAGCWRDDERMGKRLFDLLGSAAALLLLAPLMLALALWIRLDSGGPVFYRQQRVGRFGRPFRIHKFRTMGPGADRRGPLLTVGEDARVTRAGRWLRHWRLDELPQLIDVLCGEMSLVGPRPEVPRYLEQVPAALRERVLAVRPGITDPVSLAHVDEAALLAAAADPEREYVQVILPRKLQAAAEYAERATLWTDLAVLAGTLRLLVARRAPHA